MNEIENEKEFTTVTRKYCIIPEKSNSKFWDKKVLKYIEIKRKLLRDEFENVRKKLNKKGINQDEKKNLESRLNKLKSLIDSWDTYNTTSKQVVFDYTYNLVRTAMEEESRKKNYILSWIYSEMIANGVQYMDTLKDKFKFITNTINYAYRKKGSNKGSLFDNAEIGNILGGYGYAFNKELTDKVKRMVKKGILDGKCSLENYKIDSPFTISKQDMGFTYDYDNFEELCNHINDSDCKLYFDYGGNGPTIAKFRINIGHGKNRNELKSTLLKIYSGEYQYCGSKIGIEKNKIVLYLSLKVPKVKIELDENTVVGIDIGQSIPAVCALNNDPYAREYIGNGDDLIRERTKIRHQIRNIQRGLKMTSGGHGRKKKFTCLEKMKKKEKNYVDNYSHMVSKRAVDFALKYHAKYIHLENLKGYDSKNFILKNWNFYKLQQDIIYKASKYGIEVRKVNPCYTSQVCSYCGNWEPDQRKGQKDFICANSECISNNKTKFKNLVNADFNAARNIAMSTLFVNGKKEIGSEDFETARKYYGFDDKYKKYQASEESE